jgi:hypothetical protein
MLTALVAASGALALVATGADASTHLDVGTHNLLPNTAGQVVTLQVTNDVGTTPPQVNNFDGKFQIGPDSLDQSVPKFQGADFTGTFFVGGSPGGGGPESGLEQLMTAGYTVSSGTVAADGNMINLIIDTTGISSGTFDLKLRDTVYGVDSNFLPAAANDLIIKTNGFITIAPEPSATAFATLVITSLTVGRRRRSNP